MTDTRCNYGNHMFLLMRQAICLLLCAGFLSGLSIARADTMPTLFKSFAGNLNFVGTQKSLRTQPNSVNACSVVSGSTIATGSVATTANLSGIPAGATITAAYLYWAGSAVAPDYTVTFEGSTVTASPNRQYVSSDSGNYYFSGVADVTSTVAAKGNGSYSFAGLTINNSIGCDTESILGGWVLLVIYSHPSEEFRVLNLYEGFQYFQYSNIPLSLSNFKVPSTFGSGRHAHITWEGDPTLSGGGEDITFNGTGLTDGNNPAGNQFNSRSNSTNPVDSTSYGVDFDIYNLTSPIIQANQTSATTVYSTGQDLVLLSAEIIAMPNVPVSDLLLTMTRNAALVAGQAASYTLNVTNNGPLAEAGPVTVSNTLPAGLTFTSFSGTGWSCSTAGQVVTCTRSGSLANGAAAAPLTINVSVSAGAGGTITNTATVSGTNFDNSMADNTASDSYALPKATFAYYAMDEDSWGSVVDLSGNGRHATKLGSAAPTGYPLVSPLTSAIGGNPGTCGAGSFPSGTDQGVSTPIDINNHIGNAGTIMFWYRSNSAWNDGTDRMLFDASNNLGNQNADKHFYLVKSDSGRLRFALEDSTDDDEEISTSNNSFAAGQWHHIAVTWEWGGSNRIRLYLDGVQQANTGINDNIGDYSTLLLGAAKSGIDGTGNDYTLNSANGLIDEVRIYNSALSLSDIQDAMNLTHACAPVAPTHLRIEHDGQAISCYAENVKIRACANASCTTLYTAGVTGNITAGANVVPFSIPSGQSEVTIGIHLPSTTAQAAPQTVRLGTSSLSPAPTDTASPYCSINGGTLNNTTACDVVVSKAGFVFDVPNLSAGVGSGAVDIRAVVTAGNGNCVPLFQNVTRNVALWGQYQNPVTGTLPLNVNGTNIETTGAPTYSSGFSLNFDNAGKATLTGVQYNDVGLMQLNARYTGSTSNTPPDGGMVVLGSDTFVVKPYTFELSGIKCTTVNAANCGAGALAMASSGNNPAASDATGVTFIRAGHPFTVTVTAKNALGAATPNFGKEIVPESVGLTSNLVPGLDLTNNPSLSGTFGSFAGGVATGTNFAWKEAGIITLTPRVADADYLGAGDVVGTVSGNVGRFYPASFRLMPGYSLVNRAALCASGTGTGCPSTFTYMGEQMNAVFQLAAVATDGTTLTQNYSWSATPAKRFAKLDPAGAVTAGSGGPLVLGAVDTGSVRTPFPPCGATPAHPCITPGTATGSFLGGGASIVLPMTVFRGASPVGPYSALQVGIAPQDSDGVLLSPFDIDTVNVTAGAFNHVKLGQTDVRYGRLKIGSAHGSELLPLPISVTAQFWNGTTYVTNALDNSSVFAPGAAGAVVFANPRKNLAVNEVSVAAAPATVQIVGGVSSFRLAKPTGGDGRYDGSVDLTINGLSTYLPSNSGRATFGIYKGSNEFIYLRENY